MHLWTEYEGNTLAGYPVGRLSRSEGRSAFFLTVAEGQPALLRLTESHFDEGELIGRWQKAAAVSHPGLQTLRRSGQTTFDGVPLAFCVLEPNDASLSDVLRERVLTTAEAAEVAEAVAGGLAALHKAGLIHGHVDAINVFAMGEVVKLRSDCVRECTGDFEADTEEAREALRQRDVHDLGLLLRRCLTPQWEESTAMQLPNPFDRIVRRALNGSVDAVGIVEEMELLKPAKPAEVKAMEAQQSISAPNVSARPANLPENAQLPFQGKVSAAAGGATGPTSRPASTRIASVPPRVTVSSANSPAAISAMLANREPLVGGRGPAGMLDESLPRVGMGMSSSDDAGTSTESAPGSLNLRLDRVRNRLRHNAGMSDRGGLMHGLELAREQLAGRKVWVACGAVAAVLCFVLWNTTGGTHGASAPASAATNTTTTRTQSPIAPATASTTQVSAAGKQHAAQSSLISSGAQAGWHVIAYTYHYEKQAQAKAMQLKERYTSMEPQVYSPTGRAPYFVALGGPSDSVSAYALRNRARRAGLPRDTYARNF